MLSQASLVPDSAAIAGRSSSTEVAIQDDLELLLECFPKRIRDPLFRQPDLPNLLEVILDLSRPPEARFPNLDIILDPEEVTESDLQNVIDGVGDFGLDNRAGIERTLHRISAIRNRKGQILGLTCRVGRAIYGTIEIIDDLVHTGNNILLLGRPGVGKTTMLREVARVLSDTAKKRVIVVDTSNEIAGDGNIPHPAIGRSRRMQVATPDLQHSVMIEAVENHMPEAIIIDEMGTELEAAAARTIAERGVQLVATAHGNTLDNLILNPTLSDLIGGVQTVTLGDDEARYRGTQKTILERKAPPTFDIIVEIHSWEKVAVHDNVPGVVDAWLRGSPIVPEVRRIDQEGKLVRTRIASSPRGSAVAPSSKNINRSNPGNEVNDNNFKPKIFLFGIGKDKVIQATRESGAKVTIVNELRESNIILTTKSHYKRGSRVVQIAQDCGIPVHVIRKNSAQQVHQFFLGTSRTVSDEQDLNQALEETHNAARRVLDGAGGILMSSRPAYVRRLQHLLAEKYNLASLSDGLEPNRGVRVFQK